MIELEPSDLRGATPSSLVDALVARFPCLTAEIGRSAMLAIARIHIADRPDDALLCDWAKRLPNALEHFAVAAGRPHILALARSEAEGLKRP